MAVEMRVLGGLWLQVFKVCLLYHSWSFEEPKVYALRPRCY